ncbi:alkaline phosphatase [Sphingobacterium prati]|uniref:alkaline phosphatase n=1 Tax=Sphingobacterium prati TaxID=2737006 RepID=UPI001552F7EB|nr:alkaline phosphatase [Sphingobacterium prati]NPE46462.1 alkaline phosphatase [Sphingobacterium prati]
MVRFSKTSASRLGALLIIAGLCGAPVWSSAQTLNEKFEQLMFNRDKGREGIIHYAGHSHNDYWQPQPFYTAYYAGMQSIEADIFLRDGKLMVAHETKEIKMENTLNALYLDPVAKLYKKNGGKAFADKSKHLQLLIDIKENYKQLLPVLIKTLEQYGDLFNPLKNPNAIKVIVTGGRPKPDGFKDYPKWLFFDGEVNWNYDPASLAQTGLISADLKDYTDWNGKGLPENIPAIRKAIAKADSLGLPFRFYGTHDSPNAWQQLINMGVYWINTDHPKTLELFLDQRERSSFQLAKPQAIYTPSFQYDGQDRKVKRILLLIGDGMGLAAVKAATLANGGALNMTQIKTVGLSQTEALNSDNTDSAAGGSAIAVGQKVNNRAIAVDSNGKSLPSIAAVLADHGWKTGVISIGDVTDATPAVFYAHQQERNESESILGQFQHSTMGFILGGKPDWLKKKSDWKGYAGVSVEKDQINQAGGKQMVFLSDELLKPVKDGRQMILKQSMLDGIKFLSRDNKPFFLMAESAQIDYAGHANDLKYSVMETLDFDKTVAEALKIADQDPEMLVVVTADHETGGITLLDSDRKSGRVLVNFSSNDHTNAFVPVFAYGARSFLFRGVYDNTAIFHKLLEAVK